MKNKLLNFLTISLLVCTTLFTLSACQETKDTGVTFWNFETAYAEAQDLGFDGTLEDFINTISGKDGAVGETGIGIKNLYINTDGHLIVELTKGNPVDCGSVIKAHVHTISDWIIDEKATCEDKGLQHKECTECKAYLDIEFVSETGHNFKNYTCDNCGKEKYTENLQFTLNKDHMSCTLTGIGLACGADIIIPSKVYGLLVTSIGDDAFSGCSSLQSVTIGNNVTSIGYSAFYDCTSLQSIVIPDSVTSIAGSAFYGCTDLIYNEKDGLKYLGNEENKYLCLISPVSLNIVTANIDNNCKVIAASAFSGCSSLQSVTIGNNVTSIGYSAFYDCTSLQSIVIPDSVTSIGDRAFDGCASLQSIVIPDSITYIGWYAFDGCTSLQSIVIPDSVTYIGECAFNGCYRLTNIYCELNSEPVTWVHSWHLGCAAAVHWGYKG